MHRINSLSSLSWNIYTSDAVKSSKKVFTTLKKNCAYLVGRV